MKKESVLAGILTSVEGKKVVISGETYSVSEKCEKLLERNPGEAGIPVIAILDGKGTISGYKLYGGSYEVKVKKTSKEGKEFTSTEIVFLGRPSVVLQKETGTTLKLAFKKYNPKAAADAEAEWDEYWLRSCKSNAEDIGKAFDTPKETRPIGAFRCFRKESDDKKYTNYYITDFETVN